MPHIHNMSVKITKNIILFTFFVVYRNIQDFHPLYYNLFL